MDVVKIGLTRIILAVATVLAPFSALAVPITVGSGAWISLMVGLAFLLLFLAVILRMRERLGLPVPHRNSKTTDPTA
jgi:hypothetical protein